MNYVFGRIRLDDLNCHARKYSTWGAYRNQSWPSCSSSTLNRGVGKGNGVMSMTDPVVSGSPVELDPFSEDFFNAPFNTYRRLRDEAPVYHNEKYGFWALSRYEDVEPAMKDFETYSSARGITLDMYSPSRSHAAEAGHHDGSAIAHRDAQTGQQGVHTPRDRGAGTDDSGEDHRRRQDPRPHLVRCCRRLLGAVPGRDHHRDARGPSRTSTAGPGVARTGNWNATPGTSMSLPKAWRPRERSTCSTTSLSLSVGPTLRTT